MPSAGSNNSSSAIETITDVDGGGKRGQNSGGLVTFHSAPFPLGRGCSLRTARSGQGRAGVARRSEPFTARTVLRSSTRGKGVALNGPLKWPSRSPPLTHGFEATQPPPQHQSRTPVTGVPLSRNRLPDRHIRD